MLAELPPKISIVTPSFKQLPWLKLCASSIADQEGVSFEHIIQDSNSGPELEAWVRQNTSAKLNVERDKNMYDGVNRGLLRARGEICAYLNCDEQYLPGILKRVVDYFDQHPEVDLLFGDTIITDLALRPLAYRIALIPHRWHTMMCPLSILTCSTFFRRKLIEDGTLFDTDWKNLGDKSWVLRVLARGYRMALLPEPMSVFALTGANLSQQSDVPGEQAEWKKGVPPLVRWSTPLIRLRHFLEKWQHGAYKSHCVDSAAWYTPDSLSSRRTFDQLSLSWKWPAHAAKSTLQSPQRHLFVVGFARSGTSLLYSFLNLHSAIKILFEADLLSHLLATTAALSGRNWWDRLDFYNSVCRRHGLVAQPDWKNVRSRKQAAKALYRAYGGPNTQYIGEKSPTYYNCLPKLAREFPDARFIIIWRNPYNIIASITSAGKKDYFFSHDSLPLRAIMGFEQMQRDVIAMRARNIPVFDLCYEDLVEDPEGWLKLICGFLEIPFEPRMLELDHADYSMFPPGEHHAKVKSGRLSHTDRSGKPSESSFEQKIPRYLSRWNALFRGRLTSEKYWGKMEGKKPCLTEVTYDRISYHFARFYSEQFTPFIYGLFPLKTLSSYRALRERTFAPSDSTTADPSRMPIDPSVKISVITPSYKQLPWLKLCAASVADQQGVAVQHIIQDAQSGPELDEWVRKNTKAELYVECDSGMYDAINRGFARATGDIICWLNSDEQYLEGTLAKVAHYFEIHPEIDVLFGDALLVSNAGAVLSYRRTVIPNLHHVQAVHLNTLSCATFFRRSVLKKGLKLNTRWRAIADAVFVADLLQAGIPIGVLNEPLSAFTITDSNLGQTSLAQSEVKLFRTETSSDNPLYRLYLTGCHRLVKLLQGAYWPRSVSTRLYTLKSPQKRILQVAQHVDYRWYNLDEGHFIKAS